MRENSICLISKMLCFKPVADSDVGRTYPWQTLHSVRIPYAKNLLTLLYPYTLYLTPPIHYSTHAHRPCTYTPPYSTTFFFSFSSLIWFPFSTKLIFCPTHLYFSFQLFRGYLQFTYFSYLIQVQSYLIYFLTYICSHLTQIILEAAFFFWWRVKNK